MSCEYVVKAIRLERIKNVIKITNNKYDCHENVNKCKYYVPIYITMRFYWSADAFHTLYMPGAFPYTFNE